MKNKKSVPVVFTKEGVCGFFYLSKCVSKHQWIILCICIIFSPEKLYKISRADAVEKGWSEGFKKLDLGIQKGPKGLGFCGWERESPLMWVDSKNRALINF